MNCSATTNIPLRQWIEEESPRTDQTDAYDRLLTPDKLFRLKNQSLLRRTTVAYGVVELLIHAGAKSSDQHLAAAASATSSPEEFSIDNFVVQISRNGQPTSTRATWNNIAGVSMISPALNASLTEPSFLGSVLLDENVQNRMGLYLEVDISPTLPENIANTSLSLGQASENDNCHKLGMLLYELFSGSIPAPAETHQDQLDNLGDGISQIQEEPARKKATVRCDKKRGKSYHTSLQQLGLPSSISLLVQNLIDDHDLYPSLEAASNDIHLLLKDPDCYLSDLHDCIPLGGSVELRIREDKLYGREDEVSLITDAFCRVSAGISEAFFIGGYSGSGKTMLVQSLAVPVNVAGGYVLTQKVDQSTLSNTSPLMKVLATLNDLCLMIKDKNKNSPRELLSIENKLMGEFEDDFSVLVRLLPDINILCSQLGETPTRDGYVEQNHHTVQFTLQRFIRVVSSKSTPVVLFLDDCQWADKPTLDLIHAILSDRSNCFFFVGTYRDNEVKEDHPVFEMMADLDLCGVETTRVNLCGLGQDDLNVLIAETLCVFPRICKHLSDIIFEKTEGNPFFALEFLRSLVRSGLLKYSLRERRWIWDEDKIRSENITDNVLYLLSNKMSSLPENVQFCLKILSCFGNKTDEAIVDNLSSLPQFPDFQGAMSVAISERCIQKLGSDFKFVHDKVREAAYGLIPDQGQFRYDLGILLYSISKNKDHDLGSNATFQIADQINNDLSLIQPAMRLDIAELNFRAGSMAMDRSDFTTAYSYLTNAMLLLPDDHWSGNYHFSLRLYFLRANATYSCGNVEEAIESLKTLLDEGRCIEDKLDAHYYYVTILNASDKNAEAFASCLEVLSQLNETIPDSIATKTAGIAEQTDNLLMSLSDDDWLAMKDMDNSLPQHILKFYSLMTITCFYYKPGLMQYISCRMIRISFEHGFCRYSVLGFIQYAAVLCHKSSIYVKSACRIGKLGMKLLSRFDSSDLGLVIVFYYVFIAVHDEKIQTCSDKLRHGYKVAMSAGDTVTAFYNAFMVIRFGIIGGEHLPSLLEETDYYYKLASQFDHKIAKTYLAIFREVISKLIDKGASTSPKRGMEIPTEETINANAQFGRALFINRALQSFWLGYYDRCHYHVDKLLKMPNLGSHNQRVFLFYGALNAFRGVKKGMVNVFRLSKVQQIFKPAMTALKSAAELSPWNYSNKVSLLEAEKYSFDQENDAAEAAYAAAISLARSSKFIHEQGLAAELAAFHFEKNGDNENAREHFTQAKQCFAEWGSQMKVDSITCQLERVKTC